MLLGAECATFVTTWTSTAFEQDVFPTVRTIEAAVQGSTATVKNDIVSLQDIEATTHSNTAYACDIASNACTVSADAQVLEEGMKDATTSVQATTVTMQTVEAFVWTI